MIDFIQSYFTTLTGVVFAMFTTIYLTKNILKVKYVKLNIRIFTYFIIFTFV